MGGWQITGSRQSGRLGIARMVRCLALDPKELPQSGVSYRDLQRMQPGCTRASGSTSVFLALFMNVLHLIGRLRTIETLRLSDESSDPTQRATDLVQSCL
jgi:hypothetical protein